MSANDAIHVQKNSRGKFVAQLGDRDGDLPDPEKADQLDTFDSLEALFASKKKVADQTEYGFNVKIDSSNSVIETWPHQRKPFNVDAVQVTPENMDIVASWSGGKVVQATGHEGSEQVAKHIEIDVHKAANEKQKRAFVGDWVLFAGQGFKIYTDSAFKKSFVKTSDEPKMHEIRPRRSFRSGPKGPRVARNASPESVANLKKIAQSIGKPARKITEVVRPEEVEDTPQANTKTVYKLLTNNAPVTEEYAKENPETTYAERVPVNQ